MQRAHQEQVRLLNEQIQEFYGFMYGFKLRILSLLFKNPSTPTDRVRAANVDISLAEYKKMSRFSGRFLGQ